MSEQENKVNISKLKSTVLADFSMADKLHSKTNKIRKTFPNSDNSACKKIGSDIVISVLI